MYTRGPAAPLLLLFIYYYIKNAQNNIKILGINKYPI